MLATRRMISKDVCSTDVFLDMPKTSQCLYFHFVLNSDDEGFVSPRQIMRAIGADKDDLKILISKEFVIPFNTGIIVIRHWKMMNSIKRDRFKNTIYITEKTSLKIDKNKAYYFSSATETECLQSGTNTEPQHRLIKNSVVENKSVYPSANNEWLDIQTAVHNAIDYDALIADKPILRDEINGIVQIIITAILSNEPTFIINGSPVPYAIMKETLLSLKYENIVEVIKTIKDKSIDDENFNVTNHYKYVLSALFNSAATYSLFEK